MSAQNSVPGEGRCMLVLGANLAVDRILRVSELVPGAVLRALGVEIVAGGKPANVARAAVSLGGSALLVANRPAGVSTQVVDQLTAAGIRLVTVLTRGEIRSAIIVIGEDGQTTVINEPGPSLGASDAAAFLAEFAQALDRERPRMVVATGSLPPDAPQDMYATAVRLARERGAIVVIDASGSPLEGAVAAGADLVTPNLAEAEGLLHGSAGPRTEELVDEVRGDVAARCTAAARSLVAAGARAALVSGGRHGAALQNDGRAWWFDAPSVRAANTVGAGDALVAGLAVAVERGAALPAAVRFGVAAAAQSVTHQRPAAVDTGAVRAILTTMPPLEAAELRS